MAYSLGVQGDTSMPRDLVAVMIFYLGLTLSGWLAARIEKLLRAARHGSPILSRRALQ
jgi:hypothetical protein